MNYIERTNPNLVVLLHFLSKSLWLFLAAFFGYVGMKLYLIGVTASGNAKATFFGVEMTLENAGPGLVVMVVALLCSLVGAIRAKVVLSRDSIVLAAPSGASQSDKVAVIPISDSLAGVELPGGLEDLEHILGLTEVAMIRIPISMWASDHERQLIEKIKKSDLPESRVREFTKIARLSPGFKSLLQNLSSKDGSRLTQFANSEKLEGIDFSLPWCVRLRWAPKTDTVDMFICATGEGGTIKWYTIKPTTL